MAASKHFKAFSCQLSTQLQMTMSVFKAYYCYVYIVAQSYISVSVSYYSEELRLLNHVSV